MTVERSLAERVLDLAVYAPLGLVAHLREQHEAYVAAGRERFGQTVEVARFVGKMAVERGQQELRKRFERGSAGPTATSTGSTSSTAATATANSTSTRPSPARGKGATGTAASSPGAPAEAPIVAVAIVPEAGDAARLPLADYDSLAASQVVLRLDDLQPDEVEAVRAYEASHRARRTILAKIAQLQGS